MPKRLIFIFLLVLFSGADLLAADGVSFSISIQERDNQTGDNILVYSNNLTVRKNVAASAFLAGFSLDIEVISADSQKTDFNVHIVTLGAKSQALAKGFKSEFGLPAKISNVEVKPGSIYSLTLVADSLVTIDERECGYDHNSSSEFDVFPSASFDLHYLRGSLASYHAPSLKALFETEYRAFRDKFHFNISSKPVVYCFPCPVNSVIWDFRFGTASDPTRNNCYTLYHTGLNTADPFVLVHSVILRSYGYAPKFLSDGWAAYYSLAMHKMKQILKSNQNLPLSELLNSQEYLNAEPNIAEATSATFVRYLIDKYSISTFKQLYQAADDLNLGGKIETIYERPIEQLEQEWLRYIDTSQIPEKMYGAFAQRAEQMFDYPLMLEYTKAYADMAETRRDSLVRLEQLARAYYFVGAYYGAVETQAKLVKMDTENVQYGIGLATFKMMNGELEAAKSDLLSAKKLNAEDPVLQLNLAINSLERGDTASAKTTLEYMINGAQNSQLQGESRTLLGYILRKSKNAEIKLEAQNHFTVAIAYFNQQIQSNPALASPYMWTGIALLGLDDADNAYEQLQQARFLESRAFYNGMIDLWLGKTCDIRNKRELATGFYSEVIAIESAVYHQNEAQKYLETPYKQ